MSRFLVIATAIAIGVAAGAARPRAAPHPTLKVSPPNALLDQMVKIRATGLPPHAAVELEARTPSDDRSGSFLARGVYRANAAGIVDVARDASTGGTYRGIDPHGLFWSMRPAPGTASRVAANATVTFAARINHRVVARAAFRRSTLAPGVTAETLTIPRDGLAARYYSPASAPAAAVVLLGGSEGGIPKGAEAELLASHGHPTLALAYFGAPGLPDNLDRIPLEYFATALEWLGTQPDVDPQHIAIVGASRGAEAALLVAAEFPSTVSAVAALSPTANAYAGIVPGGALVPAWTLNGQGIPFGRFGDPAAAIPVQEISARIFLAAGAADTLWPSYSSVQAIVQTLRMAGRTPPTALTFPTAGHAIGYPVPNIPVPTTSPSRYFGELHLGGSASADAKARATIWPRLLHFLASA